MSFESVEVRVARLEENMKFLVNEAIEAKTARKTQYETNEKAASAMQSMETSLVAVKQKLDGQTPTIEEFITIKHKVVGAGKLGRWLWTAGAFLLGAVFNAREWILKVLS